VAGLLGVSDRVGSRVSPARHAASDQEGDGDQRCDHEQGRVVVGAGEPGHSCGRQRGAGENRGRELTYYNVVRTLLKVGDWNGSAGSWSVPLENISREGVDAAVVYVQGGNRDKPGPMLGAAYTLLH